MPSPLEHADTAAAGQAPQLPRRRRLPGPKEQARREAWGQTWGKVGADYKQQRLAKEA